MVSTEIVSKRTFLLMIAELHESVLLRRGLPPVSGQSLVLKTVPYCSTVMINFSFFFLVGGCCVGDVSNSRTGWRFMDRECRPRGRYAPGSSCRPRVTNKTVQQIKLSPTKKFGPGSIADNLGQAFEENQLNL